ncbi:MAG TPA: hypothetical protein DD473_01620 [Planctomycetaceae bacterium]|nr:hypothetical protein [Planctomycetaceae bacterium]|tara:strand:- start:635 stop:850 length:216 start_codon:yes stop_codon:yes gene_type:complete
MTQIMNLLNLAPDIQEILFLPWVEQGGDPVTERELRVVVNTSNDQNIKLSECPEGPKRVSACQTDNGCGSI